MKHPFLTLARCVFVPQIAICPTKTLAPKGYQSLQSHDNEARQKMKQNKPDGRCTTCPRWDRWHIRIPNPKDQQKLIELYRRSGTKTKSDFLRARLLEESFKVITEDESAEEYYRKLSNITAQIQKIGILYNQTVKAIKQLPLG